MSEPASKSFHDALLSVLPSLRAFAISLSRDRTLADDIVQETLLRALSYSSQFREGTNIKTWLFTILRNAYFTNHRKTKREVEDAHDQYAAQLCCHGSQNGSVDFQDFCEALSRLPADQREALVLVAAEGYSYEETAEICGCAVGTIKSRINRARNALANDLKVRTSDYGPDEVTAAVIRRENVQW